MTRGDRAASLGEALERYLRRSGLSERLERSRIVDEWPTLVGREIAQVTKAEGVSADGILWVRVASAPWMQELQLMSPAILARLGEAGRTIRRIHWHV